MLTADDRRLILDTFLPAVRAVQAARRDALADPGSIYRVRVDEAGAVTRVSHHQEYRPLEYRGCTCPDCTGRVLDIIVPARGALDISHAPRTDEDAPIYYPTDKEAVLAALESFLHHLV